MKLNAALVKTLLMAASIGMIVPVTAQTPAKPKQDKGKSPEAPKPAEKTEPEPVIAGIAIPRDKGGFLGIAISNGGFKLSFYDQKKKPIAPDVARAALHWKPNYKIGEEREVLNATGDGLSLSSPRTVRPPLTFKLFITLLSDSDQAVESYTVDFRG